MATRSENQTRHRERGTSDRGVSDVRDTSVVDLRGTPSRPSASQPRSAGDRVDSDELARPSQLRQSKYFGSPAFMRLWFSQALSSLGDWIGLFAITAIASRVGHNFAGGAVALVLAARIVPGLFLSPIIGVMVDRWNRKTIMVVSDFGRGGVLCFLPFVHNVPGLILASFILEALTLMWSPAKEASVPNIVRREFLPTANSMSLAASYGMFIPGTVLFAVLAKVPEWLGESDTFAKLHLTSESVALYFDALTYILSAAVIATLAIPYLKRDDEHLGGDEDPIGGKMRTALRTSWSEAKEGWSFVRNQPRVRAVILGMCLGLIGGGAVVPLGPPFAKDVLGAGSSGYGLLLTAMGVGVAVGVLILSVLQKRLPLDRLFPLFAFGCGATLIAAATMNNLGPALVLIALFGICSGALYVMGLTLLQTSVDDEMRGRVFVTFYTSTRLCIVIALMAPLISAPINAISNRLFDGSVHFAGIELALTGVRLTLWGGGFIVLIAGFVAMRSLKRPVPK